MPASRRFLRSTLIAIAALALIGCGSPAPKNPEKLDITASFYPLTFLAERIGGSQVTVTNLSKPGVEPHDIELTGAQVTDIAKSDVMLYLSDFQPAVTDAVKSAAPAISVDVAAAADLQPSTSESSAEGAKPAGLDPHFWLDPMRYLKVADSIAGKFTTARPEQSAFFAANLAELRQELLTLDQELTTGLSQCRQKILVTGHNAFGYLAAKYGFKQVPISGLDPEIEPKAQELSVMTKFVEKQNVRTIYSETLIDPAVVETISKETGAKVAVLDPIEGLSETTSDLNYFDIMRRNLKTLRAGQSCP